LISHFAANEKAEVRGREEDKERDRKAKEGKWKKREKTTQNIFYLLTYLLLLHYLLAYSHTY